VELHFHALLRAHKKTFKETMNKMLTVCCRKGIIYDSVSGTGGNV
jgi:hypothetical protein